MIEVFTRRRGPILLVLLYLGGFLAFIGQEAIAWVDAGGRAQSLRAELGALGSRAAGSDLGQASPKRGFVAASQTQAIASFDSFVRTTISSLGGTLLSSRPEDTDATSDQKSIAISAVFSGGIDVVQSAFYRFETGSPAISIDKVAVDPQNDQNSPETPILRVSLSMSSQWVATR
jgi:hypothetical protein